MSKITSDFLSLGVFTWISRFLRGWRGLLIATSLEPALFGQFTIFILFTVYSSILDFGILANLEREIPHYQGLADDQKKKEVIDTGWSAYFVVSLLESLFLFVVIVVIYKNLVLALVLGVYLMMEKIYRGYDANSRIHMRYNENGVSHFIQAAVSLLFVWLLIDKYGYYGAFWGFTLGFSVTIYYLHKVTPIIFRFTIDFKNAIHYLKRTFLLNAMLQSNYLFHNIGLTILAVILDKTTLGYFAFAYKIFEISTGAFPFMVRQVMRTRMYLSAAQAKGKAHLDAFISPMLTYCWVTSIFWIGIYWGIDAVVYKFAPEYAASIVVIKILMLALPLLGIMKIGSDYLSSLVHNKTRLVLVFWILGIVVQALAMYFFALKGDVFYNVAVSYVGSTFILYFLIGMTFFKMDFNVKKSLFILLRFLRPLAIGLAIVLALKYYFHVTPSINFVDTITPLCESILLMMFIMLGPLCLCHCERFLRSNLYLRLPRRRNRSSQ